MSGSQYLGQSARLRLLELGGRSPSYQDVWGNETENMRKRLLSGPTVDIRVGPERKHWSLHRNLLCHHSSYFETELHVQEKTETNGTKHHKLELPDDDPVGFELLVKWLYQGQLDDASDMSDEAKYDYAVACHKLYLLCDRFDMVRLKNISMDQYRQCLNESQLVPDAHEINDIYHASPVGSPFRSLMISIAARQIMDPEVDRNAETYRKCFENSPDFAVEMVNAIRSTSGGILFDDPTHGDHCTYHDHHDVSGCRHEGKGKARAIKAGAVNGQDAHATPSGWSQNDVNPRVPVVELPVERRTPRKLNTPRRSPATAKTSTTMGDVAAQSRPADLSPNSCLVDSKHTTQANIRSPRAPPKLERRSLDNPTPASAHSPSALACSAWPLCAVSGVTSPFDSTDTDPGARCSAAIRIPPLHAVAKSPLSTRDGSRCSAIHVNVVAPDPATASPWLGKENRPLSRANPTKANRLRAIDEQQTIMSTETRPTMKATTHRASQLSGLRGANGADTRNGSVVSARSRKRKMQDRTPKKGITGPAKPPNGAARPVLGRSLPSHSSTVSQTSSRTASIASGPRKLSRVSSVVKISTGDGGTTSIDGKSSAAAHQPGSAQTRRRPPKLRVGSQQI